MKKQPEVFSYAHATIFMFCLLTNVNETHQYAYHSEFEEIEDLFSNWKIYEMPGFNEIYNW
jgi:hypothetical protein